MLWYEIEVLKNLDIINYFLLKVRRAALQELYLKEYNSYESELKAKGLSLHKERI